MKKISVIGLGYIGLPTALIFASNGIQVVGTDISAELIDMLKSGRPPFKEKGLDELFNKAVENNIEFTSEYKRADMYIVAVPTPYVKRNKKLDPKYVIKAVESVLNIIQNEGILVIESTISPGTIDEFIRPLVNRLKHEKSINVNLVHAPERILPGNMLYELENNSRTIGADSLEIANVVKEEYGKFCKSEIIITDIKTAEMTKVIENTYRDINIAFANELAKICYQNDMNVYEIIRIANKHPRVNILQPGPGVGGHSISVDPWFLVGDYPDIVNVILAARKVNDEMPSYVLKRISDIMSKHNIKDINRVGFYGLTYKENVDDTRESPTLQILEKLSENLVFGVKTFDPFINQIIVEGQELDFDNFLKNIDILVIMVAHNHIKENVDKIKEKIIFDTRNVINIDDVYKL